jgi:hypothetical protein
VIVWFDQAWDITGADEVESREDKCTSIDQPLFVLKLSGTTSTCTSVCSITQVEAAVVPSGKKKSSSRSDGTVSAIVESRRFCVVSREGKLWVIEWSLSDAQCCKEVNCMDLQKQMRFKGELFTSQAAGVELQPQAQDTSYKLDGVATALTVPSVATASARVESAFSVMSMCAAKLPPKKAAVFIMTTNGVLISVDVEVVCSYDYVVFEFCINFSLYMFVVQSLKILAQVTVSDAGGTSKMLSKSNTGGSPVLLATMSALVESTLTLDNITASRVKGNKGQIVSALAVVLTAFDRKLYMSPGHLPGHLNQTSASRSTETPSLTVCVITYV